MRNLQHVVVGIETFVVDPLLLLQDIVVQRGGHLGELVEAGQPLLEELQDGGEDSGLHQDWKGLDHHFLNGWLVVSGYGYQ